MDDSCHDGWRTLAYWSALWRFSQTQLAVYGTYATLLIPIIAQTIIFVKEIWPYTTFPEHPLQIPSTWGSFMLELYISGLFLVIARFLTQLLCPQRIQRFPYEDDHFIFIGKIKSAKTKIENQNQRSVDNEDVNGSILANIFEKIATKELDNAVQTNSAWHKDNASRSLLRWLIATIYAFGTLGILHYLAWRVLANSRTTLSMVS